MNVWLTKVELGKPGKSYVVHHDEANYGAITAMVINVVQADHNQTNGMSPQKMPEPKSSKSNNIWNGNVLFGMQSWLSFYMISRPLCVFIPLLASTRFYFFLSAWMSSWQINRKFFKISFLSVCVLCEASICGHSDMRIAYAVGKWEIPCIIATHTGKKNSEN